MAYKCYIPINDYHHVYSIFSSLYCSRVRIRNLILTLIVTWASFSLTEGESLKTKAVDLQITSTLQRSSGCGCPNEHTLRRQYVLAKCSQDKDLDFSNCDIQLTGIEGNVFANLSVKVVNLEGNDISNVPSDFLCYTTIRRVSFRDNLRFKLRPNQKFACDTDLEVLDLVGTSFEYTGKEVFHSLKNLTIIDATGQKGCEDMRDDLKPRTEVICNNTADYSRKTSFETQPSPEPTSETGHSEFTSTTPLNHTRKQKLETILFFSLFFSIIENIILHFIF